jgi:hypothetical protein
MPYRLKGYVNLPSKILIMSDSNFSVENVEEFSAGNWEILVANNNKRIAIARNNNGDVEGYGNITPEYYEEDGTYLAITSIGDYLSINNEGDALLAAP